MAKNDPDQDLVKLAERFRGQLAAERQQHVSLLTELCSVESGSEMVDGVEQVASMVVEQLADKLGLQIERHPTKSHGSTDSTFAAHLTATTGVGGAQIVLGGHLDTTYTDYRPLPAVHLEGERMFGPGTADMRGGVVVFLAALGCVKSAGLLQRLPLTVVLNTDEERGAPSSRALLQELATNARVALFSECAGPGGELVVSRRAKLSYRIDVEGVGKHAGGTDSSKVSALVELAHKIIALEALNHRFAGTSLNVGRAWGGIASNTVPQDATALVDIRYPTAALEEPIREAVAEIVVGQAQVPGASGRLLETSFRPAWETTEATRELLGRMQRLGALLDQQQLLPEQRGGTADANWFAAAGVACLDGLGPVGFDDHTPKEHILLETLFDRALLVATYLAAEALENEE